MKICMVFYDLQAFGGLEEYAIALAVSLQQQGQPVSILSLASVPADNQYLKRIRESGLQFVQLPGWISLPASDWATKEKILKALMALLAPLAFLLGAGAAVLKRRLFRIAYASAAGWLRRQLTTRLVGPDRRQPFGRLLLRWWAWRWKPDLFHLHGYTTNLLFVIDWLQAHGYPVVYEEHQTPDSQFDWWGEFKGSINRATRVIAVSEKSAEALRAVCGVTRPITVRNPLLADPAAAGWQPGRGAATAPAVLQLTTVARLYVTKGLPYLLEAIARVQAVYPPARFTVYGDGPLRGELLERAAQLGLDGGQIFAGAFDHQDLPGIMARTDIFVLPSILEGQPLALVEAMAYGCPIVATAVGGVPELIQPEANGLLCPPADPACLAGAILRLIEDPALRRRLGQAARACYEASPFQPRALGEHFISIYGEVLREHQGQMAASA